MRRVIDLTDLTSQIEVLQERERSGFRIMLIFYLKIDGRAGKERGDLESVHAWDIYE
jgi:hypothetical protein